MLILARNSLARTCCLAVLVAGLLCAAAAADDAQATFEDLFGQSLLAVKATRDTADDVELALELLAAARLSREYPQLLTILCSSAYDLTIALDSEMELAVAAMTLLADGAPDQAVDALERVVKLRRKQHEGSRGPAKRRTGEALIDSMVALAEAQSAADDVSTAMSTMARAEQLAEEVAPSRQGRLYEAGQRMEIRRQAARRVAEYESQLASDPGDSQARAALVRLELVEMDDPAAAARHVDGSMDEFMRTYVPLAAEGPGPLSPTVAMEVGAWYMHLGGQVDATVAVSMFRRAMGYFEHAAAGGSLTPAEKLQAGLLLQDVRNKLADVSGMPLATGEYHELIELIDLRKDVLAGRWQHLDGGPRTLAAAPASLCLPVRLAGSYTLEVKFARTEGAGMAAITLPVGDTAALLKIDSSGLSGLELIDGETVVENATALLGRKLDNDRVYSLTADVAIDEERASITVRVNGRAWFSWRGEAASLSAPWAWSAKRRGAVVIGSEGSAWLFSSVRVKTSDPTCRRLR